MKRTQTIFYNLLTKLQNKAALSDSNFIGVLLIYLITHTLKVFNSITSNILLLPNISHCQNLLENFHPFKIHPQNLKSRVA